jgi:hypothetical protein
VSSLNCEEDFERDREGGLPCPKRVKLRPWGAAGIGPLVP